MAVDVLLGLQWGDEGKGKVVDLLAPKYDVIARFQGGPNAGHTLKFSGTEHVLHQIPSGVFHEGLLNIIGSGVVLDPIAFKKEITALQEMAVFNREALVVSKKTQLIVPTHRLLDAAYEEVKGARKIGSTLKGIGPAYEDKISRNGLRAGDILRGDFEAQYSQLKKRHTHILESHSFQYDLEPLEQEFFEAIEFLKGFTLADTDYLLNSHKSILAEGAQGALLDIDFGSYPFVTSSNTTTAAACTGLGIAPGRIGEVFGVFKAYCTRVGQGPFPTELFGQTGAHIRKKGGEFGATTGRERRCGWLDLPALKYAVMVCGVTGLCLMKADVLSGFEQIKVCTQYKLADGSLTGEVPYDLAKGGLAPVYQSFKGWQDELSDITEYTQLPQQLREYINFIEDEVHVPVTIVSTGPDRKQTIMRFQH